MAKSIICGVVLVVLGAGVAASSVIQSSCTSQQLGRGDILYVGGAGPGNYSKIQEAITNATNGDTIIVYPGIYYENQILINKNLVIQGANWATTIIDGSNALLANEGLVRITANGDVTFQGFTVRNAGGPSGFGGGDNKLNMGIVVYSSVSGVTYTIASNKIIGTQNPNDDYDWGFYAVSGGKENIIFANNTVTQTGCNNIVIEKTTGYTDIGYNMLDAGCWGIDPIYYMTYDGTDITTVQRIRNNTIDVGTGINPGGSANNKVTAIGFSSAWKGYFATPAVDDSGKYTNIIITGNRINNVKAWRRGIALDNFAWGDGAKGEISNAVIKNNKISGVSTAATSFGIRLTGRVTNTTIQDNEITDCDMSFWGRIGYASSSTAYPLVTRVRFNDFAHNGEGFIWEGPTILIAEYNWWGSPSGPRHPDNPGGLGDNVSGPVDYTPWLFYYGPENTLPIVNITSPVEGYLNINILGLFVVKIRSFTTAVIGRINVTVNASDNQSGIQRVEFFVDNELKGTDTSAPYTWKWVDRGHFFPYTLTVIAYDNYGNQNSDTLKVWKIY